LVVNADWGFHNSQLALSAQILVDDHSYHVQMVYPSLFPLNPPSVRPIGSTELWSNHQYGAGGDLCLEWGPDNWQETVTGADLLRSTYRLLSTERPHETASQQASVVASRHFLTPGQQLRGKILRFLVHSVTQTHLAALRKKPYWFTSFNVNVSRPSLVVYIDSLSISKKVQWQNPLFPKDLKESTHQLKGVHYRTNLSQAEIRSLDTSNLLDRLEQEGFDLTPANDISTRFVLLGDKDHGLHLYSCMDKNNWIAYETIVLQEIDPSERVGAAVAELHETRIGIVGLGSAGSKIATSLARTGIRHFLVYDYDLFLR